MYYKLLDDRKAIKITNMKKFLLKTFIKDYQNTSDNQVRKRYGLLGSIFGLITNFILFLSKIIIGLMLRLYSIVSDSINNLGDFGNNVISIFGVKMSAKKADKDHPFGHQRMEYIVSLVIGCIVIAFGLVMVYQGILGTISFVKSIVETGKPVVSNLSLPMFIASLIILSLAIIMKVMQALLYFYLSKQINSMQLKALGKDSFNDIIATSCVLIGLLITWFTSYDVDCFFTFVVAVFVIISGIGIIKEAIDELLGKKADDKLIKQLVSLVEEKKDVLGIHDLLLHTYGNAIYGGLCIEVDARKDVMESHMMIDDIEREAKEKLGINLTIHMDPIYLDDPDTEKYKDILSKILLEIGSGRYKMHDFKIHMAINYVNLIFDLVLPEEDTSKEKKEEIEDKIMTRIDHIFGKKVKLLIDFESSETDLLNSDEAK